MMKPGAVPDDLPVMLESEAALYLRLRLGDCRVWTFNITHQRRGGSRGLELPFAFKIGRQYFYAERDVIAYADAFELQHPDEVNPTVPVQVLRAGEIAPGHRKSVIRPCLGVPARAATMH